ncbi:MAG: hypothetical protein ACN4GZ_10855, partial [Acidimicrobiales bacterium]
MWNHLLRLTLGFALVVSGSTFTDGVGQLLPPARSASSEVAAPVTPQAPQPTPGSPPAVELVDLPPAVEDLATWALDLFDSAGLELPPLRFEHHESSTEACHGRVGSHRRSKGVSVINLCTSDITGATQVMVLHETAHAWAAHSLDDDRKAAFKDLRGWEHWRDYKAAPWHENGTEQAAEFLVWGLLDRPYSMVRIYHS